MKDGGILDGIDLKQKLPRKRYKELMPELEIRLGKLQRQAIEARLPVVVMFEGWEAAGKGTLINRFIRTLDPRHFRVYSIQAPTEEEKLRPFLWRFWSRLPPAGTMSVLDRSWYGRVLQERVDKSILKREWQAAYEEIECFERQLVNGGYLLIKLFLHISRSEQKKRFVKLESTPATAWRITKQDWIHHENYRAYRRCAEDMLVRSSTPEAPWQVIASQNRRAATIEVLETISKAVTKALKAKKAKQRKPVIVERTDRRDRRDLLAEADLSLFISREDYGKRLDRFQSKIRKLEHEIYRRRLPVVIAYEGWDAAGKGGNIKRLTQSMDPRGYQVIPIGAPNEVEKRHHYLWRFWRALPKAGHVGIFDRSWYGRVLVERVEGFCSEAEWRRAYQEINEMERQLVNAGTVLVKFWVHIDKKEQLRRFKEREATSHKLWKITDEDWRNRERWDDYLAAVRDMLAETSTKYAPWTVVESNSKHYARLKALRTVIKAIERGLAG